MRGWIKKANKAWWLPTKLTHRDKRHGNQATMIQSLMCTVGDRQSLWEQGCGAPEETSERKLKDGGGNFRCRGKAWHPRQRHHLSKDRKSHRLVQVGKPKHRTQPVLLGCRVGVNTRMKK